MGWLILLEECIKHGISPFISDGMCRFYHLGFREWRQGSRSRLLDTCRADQDIFSTLPSHSMKESVSRA